MTVSSSALVTELLPYSLATWDAASLEGIAQLRARYARTDSSYVRLNMITSLTGSAAGADGTSETLTNDVDRAILRVIREDADVVLVGAQSVRAEGYVVPRKAPLAVVTSSGDLSGARLRLDADAGPGQVLIVCAAERADEVRATAGLPGASVVAVPMSAADGQLAPHAILAALAARGLTRVVCEGGPSLASQFARDAAIDEFCVTVAPVLEPVDAPFLRLSRRSPTHLAGQLVDSSGFSYLRLRAAQ